MTNQIPDIKRAAVLQEIGRPFVSLYVDVNSRILYLFVLISSFSVPTETYIAVKTSPETVEKYLENELSLSQLFSSDKMWEVSKEKQQFNFKPVNAFIPTKNMKALNLFDSDFCPDEWSIESFLEGYRDNISLEIV